MTLEKRGQDGNPGLPGERGERGIPGERGESAYEIAKKKKSFPLTSEELFIEYLKGASGPAVLKDLSV